MTRDELVVGLLVGWDLAKLFVVPVIPGIVPFLSSSQLENSSLRVLFGVVICGRFSVHEGD